MKAMTTKPTSDPVTETDRPAPRVLKTAEFHPLVRLYLFLIVIFYFTISVVGIVLIPLWLVGPGQWWAGRYYRRLKCELRDRELYFRRGILVRSESTIPLDRITDLTVKEGPLLRMLGLSMMHVETPGTSGTAGVGGISLIGIIDTPRFRDQVLGQRDRLQMAKSSPPSTPILQSEDNESLEVLREIRNSLGRIETKLREDPGK